MNDAYENKRLVCVLDMIDSLNKSVLNGGGMYYTLDRMKKETVYDLILLLSVNGIRFTYDPKKSSSN